jgi:hypothetical protein
MTEGFVEIKLLWAYGPTPAELVPPKPRWPELQASSAFVADEPSRFGKVRNATNKERYMFADAGEVREATNKSPQACARARVGERPVSWVSRPYLGARTLRN